MGCRHFTGASISLLVMFARANLMFMRWSSETISGMAFCVCAFLFAVVVDARDGLLAFNLAAQENLH